MYPTTSTGKNTPALKFDVVNTCTLNKINLTCTIANYTGDITAITPRITSANGADVWRGNSVTVDSNGTFTLNNTSINVKMDVGTGYTLDFLKPNSVQPNEIIRPLTTSVGTIAAGHDIVANARVFNDTSTPWALVANVQSTSYTPTPGQTVVVYGDSKQTTNWTQYAFTPAGGNSDYTEVYLPFKLKKAAKVKINFSTQAKTTDTYYNQFFYSIRTENGSILSDNNVAFVNTDWQTKNISIETKTVVPAGTYYIYIDHYDSAIIIKYSTTTGTLTNDNYIEVLPDALRPSAIIGHAQEFSVIR